MPTSELSDALNPHVIQTRQRNSSNSYATPHLQPVVQPPQAYIPHRSELELAISEPPPPPPRTRTQPSSEVVHAVQELLRVLSASKEAQEIDRKRRLSWEREQEAKHAQKQAEMENLLFEMRQELTSLRNVIAVNPSAPTAFHTPQCNDSMISHQQLSPSSFPISPPVSQTPSYHNFSEGSSNQPSTMHYPYPLYQEQLQQTDFMAIGPPSPAPSPVIPASIEPSSSKRQKKRTASPSEDDSSGSESYDTPSDRIKRVNHRDTRCLSIHQAMRLHIFRLMKIEPGENLPDGHFEGAPLGPHDPVRFVWNKTPKQSVHNSRMKARILADLKSNRKLYKHVPDKDFNKKALDSVFDQSYVTLRQKFKAQSDASAALNVKKREETKAMKARRLCRKKVKLSNRAEARMRLEAFEHSIFDGAFQIECISSEESDGGEGSLSSGILRSRGLPWRSSRLQRFYHVLDKDEALDKSQKPKRGFGKKQRSRGPNKEGFYLPPKGAASWMISKRWMIESQTTYPDLLDMLKKIVAHSSDFDWEHFDNLGEESGNEM